MVASYLEKAIDLEIMRLMSRTQSSKRRCYKSWLLAGNLLTRSGATEGSAVATIKMRHELRELEPAT
jgi:hypothetical protein